MAPWEELPYFNLPISSTVIIPPGQTLVARKNPMRVFLMIVPEGNSPQPIQVRLDQSAAINGIGITVNNSTLPLILRASTDPGLCQAEWYADGPAGSSAHVIEVTMNRWPEGDESKIDKFFRTFQAFLKQFAGSVPQKRSLVPILNRPK